MKRIVPHLRRVVRLALLLVPAFVIGMLVGIVGVDRLDTTWVLAISAAGTVLFTMTIAVCTYYYSVSTEHLWKVTQFSILMQKKSHEKSPDWWGWYDGERQCIKEEVHKTITDKGGPGAASSFSELENRQFRHHRLRLFFENDPAWQSDIREQVRFMRSIDVEPKDVASLKDLVEHFRL